MKLSSNLIARGITLQSIDNNLQKQTEETTPKDIKLIKDLEIVLEKNVQNRNNADNLIINEFSEKSHFFKRLNETKSNQLSKNLIKNAIIHRMTPKKFIYKQTQPAQSIFLVLAGACIKISPSRIKGAQNITFYNKFDEVMQKADRYMRLFRITTKNLRADSPRLQNCFNKKNNLNEEQIYDVLYKDDICGFESFLFNDIYPETIVTFSEVIVLEIKCSNYMNAMNCYRQKVLTSRMNDFLKASNIFSNIQYDRFRTLVESSQIIKKKKGEIIYKQNQTAKFVYILIQGQILLKKTVEVFKEDPNNFYINRNYLGEEVEVLPYANLQNLYNYQPKVKTIQISILSNSCIFGQEQVHQNIPRQITAEVKSMEAKIYKISSKYLQFSVDKKLSLLELIFKQITSKKIILRQEKLSERLNFENKKLDYFYINNEQQEQVQQQSKNKPAKSHNFSQKTKRYNLYISPRIQKRKKKQQQGPKHEPFYTTYNFSDLQIQPKKSLTTRSNSRYISTDKIKPSQSQSKIHELSHTISMLNEKIQLKIQLSRKLGLKKQLINSKNPLFEMNYFSQVKKQALRIENNHRKNKYTSMSRVSTRPQSAKTTQTLK